MRDKIIVLSLLLAFGSNLSNSLHCQALQFSGDSKKFTAELKEMLRGNLSAENQNHLVDLVKAWDNDSLFSQAEKKTYNRLSARLLEVKARPYPHIYDFLMDVYLFHTSNLDTISVSNWMGSVELFLKQPRVSITKLGKLFENTLVMVSGNIVYKAASGEWRQNNSKFILLKGQNPSAKFENITLSCYSRHDSICIFNTSGVFNLIENTWTGVGGKVTWERAGYHTSDIIASLSNYRIDMSRLGYSADSVTFTYSRFFDHPISGILKDEVTPIISPERATYPVFDSYRKNFNIKSIYENMNYKGGLSMQGAKLVGSGNQRERASLYIFRNDTLFMKVFSSFFVFRKDKLIGRNVSVSVLFEKDSIYHGELDFTYIVDSKEFSFMHTDNYSSNSPWFNSYHNIDMSFDRLVWKSSDPKLYFTMQRGASIGVANFESRNYFSGQKFSDIQLHDPINPLISIRNFVKFYLTDEFPATDYAAYMKLPVTTIRNQLFQLAVMGFLYYNAETDYAKVKPKLYDYINASLGRIDYDVMSLVSRTDAPLENASLDLRNFDLSINGTPLIMLSDSQNVAIIPSKGNIIMKRNRSFQFDGKVIGGLFVFYGKNFFFNYDKFKINLQHIDSMSVSVISGEKDNYGRDIIKPVKNLVEHAKGELLIDDPGNKSGIKSYPQYPIFNSNEFSYVYYDSHDIQNGIYTRDKFYFKIVPYQIDSLDNYRKEEMKFRGKFVSAGILPDLDETLSLRPDYSMGFVHTTTEAGLPLYNGKGKVFNVIDLSNRGLKTIGSVDYLTSKTTSDDITLFPDSMNTLAKQFKINQKLTATEYPRVEGQNTYVHWLPKKDELYAEYKKEPFVMYNDTTTLTGNLKLTPKSLTGSGLMDMRVANITSELYTFKSFSYHSDTSDFNLKTVAQSDKYTFVASNLKSNVDFSLKKGTFTSNTDLGYVEFPENQYLSYLDYFTWKMDVKELELGSNKKFNPQQVPSTYKDIIDAKDRELIGARFVSINKTQDSLSFISPLAVYDYKVNVIKASQVKYIKVADAKIIPDKGNVEIEPRAEFKKLENAVSIANNSSHYHSIHTASIKISGRYSYKGSGDYDYKDETGKIQLIHFNEVGVDTAIQTYAKGEILTTQDFTLSPAFEYQGKVFLYANQKYLTYKGGVRIRHTCETLSKAWLSFTSIVNPDSIYIPVPEKPMDINRNPIYAGLFMTSDSIHIYSGFLSLKKNYVDMNLYQAQGSLHYNKDSMSYIIAPAQKILDNNIPGNLLSLNRNKCTITGEGLINLGVTFGKMQFSAAGSWSGDLEKNSQAFNLFMVFDFPFLDKAASFMASDFDSLPGAGPVDLGSKKLWKSIELFAGHEKTLKMKDDISLYGAIKEMPAELAKTIVLNDVKLKWNAHINAYQSYGKIGVGNILSRKVNKYVEGYVEIVRKRSGDLCDIYLKINDKNWYYFGYSRGVMQTLSSNVKYIESIKAESTEARTTKARLVSETPFTYMLASDTKMGQFMRKYRQVLAGDAPAEEDEGKQ